MEQILLDNHVGPDLLQDALHALRVVNPAVLGLLYGGEGGAGGAYDKWLAVVCGAGLGFERRATT